MMVEREALALSLVRLPHPELTLAFDPDEEATVDELKARIAKVVAFVEGLSHDDVDAGFERMITIKLRDRSVEMRGVDYFNNMAMPNFYFHTTTAYAILRHSGVPVGKRDFVGV